MYSAVPINAVIMQKMHAENYDEIVESFQSSGEWTVSNLTAQRLYEEAFGGYTINFIFTVSFIYQKKNTYNVSTKNSKIYFEMLVIEFNAIYFDRNCLKLILFYDLIFGTCNH